MNARFFFLIAGFLFVSLAGVSELYAGERAKEYSTASFDSQMNGVFGGQSVEELEEVLRSSKEAWSKLSQAHDNTYS